MDFVISQVHRLYYAEEGTTLAQFAVFTKYCLLMGIPFVGWTIIEIFFCLLNNPLLFATVWVLLALIGAIAECFISSRGMSSTNLNISAAQTLLGQVGLAAAPSNIYPSVFETDINNNRNVDIVQVNSDQARAVPDVGTQTPEISEPRTPTPDERSPSAPSTFSMKRRSGKVIPDVGTQTPQDSSHMKLLENKHGISSQAHKENGHKTIQSKITTPDAPSELELENEFEIQDKILDAATTWILAPTKLESSKDERRLKTEKNIFVEDGDPFLELNSVTNSEVLKH
jgi:hypothetical protein